MEENLNENKKIEEPKELLLQDKINKIFKKFIEIFEDVISMFFNTNLKDDVSNNKNSNIELEEETYNLEDEEETEIKEINKLSKVKFNKKVKEAKNNVRN